MDPRLSVVCPVYNEGANIGRQLDELARGIALSMEVLLVYDRDDDDTLPPARARVPSERATVMPSRRSRAAA